MDTARLVLGCWGLLLTMFVVRQVVDFWRNPPAAGNLSWPGLLAFLLLCGASAYRLLTDSTALWALVAFGVAYLLASVSIGQTLRIRLAPRR